jgi:hypothetical protein
VTGTIKVVGVLDWPFARKEIVTEKDLDAKKSAGPSSASNPDNPARLLRSLMLPTRPGV